MTVSVPIKMVSLSITGIYKVGDPPPTGYVAWHEWARVQYNGGLRQTCGADGKWRFPKEVREFDS